MTGSELHWLGSIVLFYFHTAHCAEVTSNEDLGITVAFVFYTIPNTHKYRTILYLNTCICDTVELGKQIHTNVHVMSLSPKYITPGSAV